MSKVTHEEYAAGLRAAADFYEAHQEVPLPYDAEIANYRVDSKEEAEAVVRALGSCKKEYNEYHLRISKEVAPGFMLMFCFSRENVCVRKVIGVETIPAKYIEAHVEPARTKELVEWECSPVLSPAEE